MTKEIINGIDVSECPCKDDDKCLEVPILNEYGDLIDYQDCEPQTLCPYRSKTKIQRLLEENEKLKKTINRLQKDCERNNDLYMKERDKNYKLSEISKEYNARRCIEKLYRLICDDTKSVQETYITLKDEVSEFLRIHKTMSSKYEEVKQTYKQALEEIKEIAQGMHDWWINKTPYTDVYELAEHLLGTELNRILGVLEDNENVENN